ncbi:MAG: hypothetical protein KM312_12280 [Hydrogenibacillus schlegelii]|uniref:Uncharacterized protein n=1 Tax=Hydrogenibacillus schlegelii TaxID=1484 RepID=A0A947CZM3_HYDSH|nr:hypothetical protein [Hydrogenibacillus schlegelii]
MNKKIAALALAIALSFTSIPAFATENQYSNQYLLSNNQATTVKPPTAEPQGIRGKVVSFAVRQIAQAIRYGGKELNYIVGFLDRESASILSRYAYQIADRLDYIALIPDLTAEMVKTYIYNFLTIDLKLSGRVAMPIADAIKAAINWLIF